MSPLPDGRVVDNVGVGTWSVRFDEDVAVPAGSVRAWGLTRGDLALLPLEYDAATRTLLVRLVDRVVDDVVTLVIDYTVTDAAGNELDGEVATPTALAFPSGDGVRGGRFVARYGALQGDADRDNVVDGDDAIVVRDSLGKTIGDAGFDPRADLNADGVVNVLDVAIWAGGLGLMLTTDDGTSPGLLSFAPDPALPLFADAAQVVLSFDEAVDPARVSTRDLFVVGSAGLRTSDAVAIDAAARTAKFTFDPPLTRCDRYRVGVSNAFADASGALVSRPVLNPTLDGLLPPSQPILDPLPEITSQQIVTVSGSTQGAAQVRVVGPEDVYLVPVVDGRFTADVELPTDFVHTLYVSAVSPCGPTSAPSTARVTRDTSGPVINVDFPLPGQQITTPTVNVLGRLTDEFSGSKGLTATVNGITAAVDPAGGGNAVFAASKVNLQVGLNDIVVVATDTLGNSRTKTVSVERVIVPEGTPTIELHGGDDQAGPVLVELSRPVEVLLKRPDGLPLVNKVVTFTIDRNDGRLGATAGSTEGGGGGVILQVFTDSSGIARAFWRLGSTAGAAANRLKVVSQDLVGTVYVTATGQGAAASRILVGDMNNQKAEAGAPLPQPLFAYVTDGDAGNPVAHVPVVFTVAAGNGSFAGEPTITVPTGLDGRAMANFTLGATPGVNLVEATFEGNPGLPAVFSAVGVARVEGGQTTLSGLVLDNANRPIGGALCTLTVTLDFPSGPDTVILGPVTSGVDGRFIFDSSVIPEGALNTTLPGGPAKVLVSGVYATTLNGEPITQEWTFPYVGYEIVLVQGAANTLQDPVWLPELDPANEVVYDGTQDVVLRVAGIDGLEFRVKAGSLTREDGTRPTPKNPEVLRLNQVHFDEVPMPLPNGNAFPFAWTLQPKNARFDPPIEVVLPNLTGLAPGSIAQILQWNNDVTEFQAMGTGKVSANGSVIVSEPGSGITVAGWGGGAPPPPPTVEVNNVNDPLNDPNVRQAMIDDIIRSNPQCGMASCAPGIPPNHFLEHGGWIIQDGITGEFRVQSWPPGAPCRQSECSITPTLPQLQSGDAVVSDYHVHPRGRNANGVLYWEPSPSEADHNGVADVPQWLTNNGIDASNYSGGYVVLSDRVYFVTRDRQGGWTRSEGWGTGGGRGRGPDPKDPIKYGRGDVPTFGCVEFGTPVPPYQDEVLDHRTTARLGGQSAVLSPAGVFRVLGIPVSDGLRRLTLIGQRDGGALYGTVFVDASREGIVAVGQVGLAAVTPPSVPLNIDLLVPMSVLVVGQSVQTSVLGTQSDGTVADLTARAAGTSYSSSNATVASVGQNGLIAATAPGVAFIIAANEATTAVRRLTVASTLAQTTVVGMVLMPDGSPAVGAAVTTPLFGGSTMSGDDGSFAFTLTVPSDAQNLQVRASLPGTRPASGGVVPVVLGGFTDAGVVRLLPPFDGPLFAGPQYDTGIGPKSVSLGDLDGDGDLDMAIANATSDNMSVLLNSGGGVFALPVNYPAGDEPVSVSLGDLDGDGDLDVAVANYNNDNVSVLLNVGNGTFAARVNYGASDEPTAVALGDLDEDGDLDIVVANYNGESASVLLNIGNGTFAPRVNYFGESGLYAVALGDLDGDNDLDMVVANFDTDSASVLRNNGSGSFAAPVNYPVGDGPSCIALGDLDGDGDVDAAVTNVLGGSGTSVLMNAGDGTFAPRVAYATSSGPQSIYLGDLDADDDLDMAVALNAVNSRR